MYRLRNNCITKIQGYHIAISERQETRDGRIWQDFIREYRRKRGADAHILVVSCCIAGGCTSPKVVFFFVFLCRTLILCRLPAAICSAV